MCSSRMGGQDADGGNARSYGESTEGSQRLDTHGQCWVHEHK